VGGASAGPRDQKGSKDNKKRPVTTGGCRGSKVATKHPQPGREGGSKRQSEKFQKNGTIEPGRTDEAHPIRIENAANEK